MRYQILEDDGKYAIERTLSVLGFVTHRERLDLALSDFWWSANETNYWVTSCWSDDKAMVMTIFRRLVGDVERITDRISGAERGEG